MTNRARTGTVLILLAPLSAAAFAAGTVIAPSPSAPSPASAPAPSAPRTSEAVGLEFFEKRVRPVLVEHCYPCHGPEKTKSGLRLDGRDGILKGGDRGPAVIPGKLAESLLVHAIRYDDEDLSMPPKGKLPPAKIADLEAWVKMGAPAPTRAPSAVATKLEAFDFEKRRQHWAYQPIVAVRPPPEQRTGWSTSAIDRFIEARLVATGLQPAAPADRRTLIRRVTFDLIGLPPTASEVSEFLADRSPRAFDKVVDRLLASPHYGERWGRHWLDLVRYSETLGSEYDYQLYNSWRYRDYIIRAFNADLPYDQLVIEHLAGDLVNPPRIDPASGTNESILGTAFFWMIEGKQSPVDIRQEQLDRIDNQIDVIGKTFLGQTIACARCHDHKFDAISTRDYYGLAGYFKSSRFQQAFLDPPERMAANARETTELRQKTRTLTATHMGPLWLAQAGQLGRYLLATRQLLSATEPGADEATTLAAVANLAKSTGLDPRRLNRWVTALRLSAANGSDQPFSAWATLATAENQDTGRFNKNLALLQTKLRARRELVRQKASAGELFEDFTRPHFEGWSRTGAAFGLAPAVAGDVRLWQEAGNPVLQLVGAGAHSGLLSGRLEGELRSRTFTLGKRYVHFLVAGHDVRVHLVVDGYTLIMDPIYGGLMIEPRSNRPTWHTMDAVQWKGHRAFVELSDSTVPRYIADPGPYTGKGLEGPNDGFVTVEEIRFSDDASPPPPAPSPIDLQAIEGARAASPASLADSYQATVIDQIGRWKAGGRERNQGGVALLDWLLEHGLFDQPPTTSEAFQVLSGVNERYRKVEANEVDPMLAPALADGTGEDERVLLRGNYETPGEVAPRGPPRVLAANWQPQARTEGSGRLALARRLVDKNNPLLARVMVNRLWQHHFGQGIVATPDDFGKMGQPPTHPELLDHLATALITRGFSLKQVHRLLLLSSSYQMSSQPSARAMQIDPENKLLQHMPVQRLEAEAIRDSILAVSGRFEPTLYGPSVLPYLPPTVEGKGRPAIGPLDGQGRRSIYLSARRNFPTPLLLAFDLPASFTTVGRRGTSTVPTQALALMNDPFVAQQAKRWADRVLAVPERSATQRIEQLYRDAFVRTPDDDELRQAQAFLTAQQAAYRAGVSDPRAWADLCHVLFNLKEFIFVP